MHGPTDTLGAPPTWVAYQTPQRNLPILRAIPTTKHGLSPMSAGTGAPDDRRTSRFGGLPLILVGGEREWRNLHHELR